MIEKLLKYYHTIKYLKLIQIYYRVFNLIKLKVFKNSRIKKSILSGDYDIKGPSIKTINHDPWNTNDKIDRNLFTFLNLTKNFNNRIDWDSKKMPFLWRYNLNYFNYLHLIKDKEKLCLDWIRNNPLGKTIGWHPYPTSLRIINWINSKPTNKEIISSIFQQTDYLFKNIEFHLLNNHVLENICAIIFAGNFFNNLDKGKRWLIKGTNLLFKHLDYQIMEDGGHFERSPMYHGIILKDLLDVISIYKEESNEFKVLKEYIKKMADFLISVTHPDGEIALFNDSTQEIAPSTQVLLNDISGKLNYYPQKLSKFPETGYYIYNSDNIYLIIDAGKIGPDFNPGHAHSDIFSFELSIKGKQIIVDSGTYNYEKTSFRNYLRSSKAHNTISIDGKDHIECWDKFRVARRFSPKNTKVKYNEEYKFISEFEGFAKLIGDNIIQTRTICVNEDRKEILINDKINGKKIHQIQSSFHFHPHYKLIEKKEFIHIQNEVDDSSIKLFTKNEYRIEKSFYCPKFGLKIPNQVIRIQDAGGLPIFLEIKIYY